MTSLSSSSRAHQTKRTSEQHGRQRTASCGNLGGRLSDHLKKVKQPGTSSLALLVMGGTHHLDDPVEGVSGTSPHKLDIRGSQLGVNIIRTLLGSGQQGSRIFTIQPSKQCCSVTASDKDRIVRLRGQ